MKIMNLGDARTAEGVAAVLQNDDDDAVDPHLERIRNEAGGDESDEEVNIIVFCGARWFLSSPPNLSFFVLPVLLEKFSIQLFSS